MLINQPLSLGNSDFLCDPVQPNIADQVAAEKINSVIDFTDDKNSSRLWVLEGLACGLC